MARRLKPCGGTNDVSHVFRRGKNNNKRIFNLQRLTVCSGVFSWMGLTDINYSAHSGVISCDRPNAFKEIIKHPHRAGRPTAQTQQATLGSEFARSPVGRRATSEETAVAQMWLLWPVGGEQVYLPVFPQTLCLVWPNLTEP